jgi:DNA-binding CsgD family transcriptional regulator
MYLSVPERNKTLKLIETLNHSLDSSIVREAAGYILLDLLQADQFASFVWDNENKNFDQGLSINMSEDNLANYGSYYQHKDPITGKLSKHKSATLVNQIITQQSLMKTEFYNDFLAKDGLHYGVNLHAYAGNDNVGDFRVWRKQGRARFDDKAIYTLNLIKPFFCNAMKNIQQYQTIVKQANESSSLIHTVDLHSLMTRFPLTKLEAKITLEITHGLKDDAIVDKLHIPFSTLRTYIKHIFYKLEVNNKTLLIRKIRDY